MIPDQDPAFELIDIAPVRHLGLLLAHGGCVDDDAVREIALILQRAEVDDRTDPAVAALIAHLRIPKFAAELAAHLARARAVH